MKEGEKHPTTEECQTVTTPSTVSSASLRLGVCRIATSGKKNNLSRVNGSIFRKESGRGAWHRGLKLFSAVSKTQAHGRDQKATHLPWRASHPDSHVMVLQLLTEESAGSWSPHLRHINQFLPHRGPGCRLGGISPTSGSAPASLQH